MILHSMIVTALVLIAAFCSSCMKANCGETTIAKGGVSMDEDRPLGADVIDATVKKLEEKFGKAHAARIRIGVKQSASMWRERDGSSQEFTEFCETGFLTEEDSLDQLFQRFQSGLEQILGHLHEVDRFLREPTDLDRGPVAPIDRLFAEYDLNAHVIEDLFKTKIAFLIVLNFKIYSLEEMLQEGKDWDRSQWAKARSAQMFQARVPSEISQKISSAFVTADSYISDYNIHMHHLLTKKGERLFPKGMKLISHWGLRDELKSQYAKEDGFERQRLIQMVMEKIIAQEIPAVVVDNPHLDWVVETGEVRTTNSPDTEGSHDHKLGQGTDSQPEPNTRYDKLLGIFHAVKGADPYYPIMPTYIDRKFNSQREIPKEEVKALLESVLKAPVIGRIGKLVEKRLGRKLAPFDIWYDGFKARGSVSEEKLDAMVSERYPNVEAFQKDIPNILDKLGFDAETAAFLGTKIAVDPARGAGHAMGAGRREDKAHLRTRVPAEGMNYKGYNIAVHELGHNVEQVLSLNRIDHYMLEGVPNTAFTEGFAFVFQGKDLELLGIENKDPMKEHLEVLDNIWGIYEIGGVAMVDIEVWDWMYAHPDATPAELKEAFIKIAKDVWNRYFAPVFGQSDQPLLAIYSHMIDAGMYIPDYPIGGLIQFQVEDFFKGKSLAAEMERMCRLGSITPATWMQEAVGGPVSAEPLIEAAEKAVEVIDVAPLP